MDKSILFSYEHFCECAKDFVNISENINDGWKLKTIDKAYGQIIIKEAFIQDESNNLLKAEYVVSYSSSYNVPLFSFNIWNSSGILLSLEEIRQKSLFRISPRDFFSVITQQEHHLFHRPYFTVHPCHTESLLSTIESDSHNVLVSFLSVISPLVQIKMPLEYAVTGM